MHFCKKVEPRPSIPSSSPPPPSHDNDFEYKATSITLISILPVPLNITVELLVMINISEKYVCSGLSSNGANNLPLTVTPKNSCLQLVTITVTDIMCSN